MKRLLILASIVAAVALLAPPANAAGSQVFALTAQNGSGENGAVILTPLGDKTRVMVAIANAPTGAIQPVHFHVGPCATLNPKPMYPLKNVDDGISTTILNIPIDKLVGQGLAVNVHKSGAEIGVYTSCGNIGK
jgi:hypothetical protein